MEKKNTILLTVIAIATLLVAVVGATFAYFTAQVTTSNEENKSTSVTTYTMPTVKMDFKDITTKIEEGILPGTTIVKPMVVSGECAEGKTCADVDAYIEITASIDEEFLSDVTWKLYKGTTTGTNEISCTVTPHQEDGKAYATSVCTDLSDTQTYPVLESGSETITSAVKHKITVESGKTETYYLVVEYNNNKNDAQDDQQGKNFTINLNFKVA